MNDELNNGLKYDQSRLNDMQNFLNHILIIAHSNPNLEITSEIIYNELKNWNIKSSDRNKYGRGKNVEYYFQDWINNFKNVKDIDAFRTKSFHYWCQFTNKADFDSFIKIYIPIDGEHLKEGVNQLFNFIARNGIRHSSKVGTDLRSDNVIVRINKDDKESLKKIIDFINNNRYLKVGLNPVNPFLPTINGIGVMNDPGISYNSEISKVISSYIAEHRFDRKININDFIEYAKNITYSEEVKDTFDIATSKQERYFDSKNSKNKELSEIQKQSLLYDTVKATIDKYGINQACAAIRNVIDNSYYGHFTNGNNGYKNMISKNISDSDMLFLIQKVIHTNGDVSLDYIIQSYCNFVYKNKLISIFDDMCKVTMENHGKECLCMAIKQFYLTGNPNRFSRHRKNKDDKTNYREYSKYFNKDNLMQVLSATLLSKGIKIDLRYLESSIYQYVNTLEEANYNIVR